jgi:hypothetical protein
VVVASASEIEGHFVVVSGSRLSMYWGRCFADVFVKLKCKEEPPTKLQVTSSKVVEEQKKK